MLKGIQPHPSIAGYPLLLYIYTKSYLTFHVVYLGDMLQMKIEKISENLCQVGMQMIYLHTSRICLRIKYVTQYFVQGSFEHSQIRTHSQAPPPHTNLHTYAYLYTRLYKLGHLHTHSHKYEIFNVRLLYYSVYLYIFMKDRKIKEFPFHDNFLDT